MMVMAIFASVITPIGELFAIVPIISLKVNDFGESILGHGGRLDCQVRYFDPFFLFLFLFLLVFVFLFLFSFLS